MSAGFSKRCRSVRCLTVSGRLSIGRAASLLVLLSCTACYGCDDPLPPPLADSPQARGRDIDPLGKAIRPARRYIVDNNNSRCEVYWMAGETRSVRRKVKCPREIEPGERLWLSGRVCFRDSDDASRRVPVRCPPPVLRSDIADRADAGQYMLPEAAPDAEK